jgi:ABC-type molybdate transport system ATPase subunit
MFLSYFELVRLPTSFIDNMKYKIFIKSKNRTLVDINHFELKPNHINFLFGESGIGKTLIARTIYGLLNPDDLFISINSQPYDSYLKNPECTILK